MQAPNVFEHQDYRAFLRSFYAYRKSLGHGFSLRVFSRQAGLTSSNYLKLVMDGQRNLSSTMAARFAEACRLKSSAADHFCSLVALDQAKTHAERERAYARLRSSRQFKKVHPLDSLHSAYHSEWYIPAIRELAARKDFRADPKWISRVLLPPITTRQAEQALRVLRELDLLIETADGAERQSCELVQTPDHPLGHHVVRFHRSMMDRAKEALDIVPREEREIASLTLCLSAEKVRELKARLRTIRAELLEDFGVDPAARRVVQVNFQLFPLSIKED